MAGVRDKMQMGLQKKTKESHDRKDQSGSFKDYYNPDTISGVPKFNAGKGTHIIDILPYQAGTNDPHNAKGDWVYVLDVLVHMGVGPADEKIVCPAQYNRPCPICEEIKRLNGENADYKTEIKPHVAKRRTMYNVIVREDAEQEKKGVQLFEMAHYFLEKNIATLAKKPRGGGYIVFSDPDVGKSIGFTRIGVGAQNTEYNGYQFVDRPEVITDKELEGVRCLDDLILIREYDEIYAIFHAVPAPAAEDSDSNTGESEEEAPEVPQAGRRKLPPKEEVPADEEVPSAPVRGTRKPRATVVCPVADGTLGVTLDEFTECDTCDHYDACEAAMGAAAA